MTAKKDEPKKRAKIDPVPIIGIRNSHAVSGAKLLIGVVGASAVALPTAAGRAAAIDQLRGGAETGVKIQRAAESVSLRLGEIRDRHGFTIGALVIGGALFGKRIDQRLRDFPIKLGR